MRFRPVLLIMALCGTVGALTLDEARPLVDAAWAAHAAYDPTATIAALEALDDVVDREAAGSLLLARLLTVRAYVAGYRRDFDGRQRQAEAALALFEALAPAALDGVWPRMLLADQAHRANDLKTAGESLTAIRARLEAEAPESLEMAACLGRLSSLAADQSKLDEAMSLIRASLELRQRLTPETAGVAATWNQLGTTAYRQSNYPLAREAFETCLAAYRRLEPDSRHVAGMLSNLSAVSLQLGDLDAAADYSRQALEIRERIEPDSLDVADSLGILGNLERRRGRPGESAAWHQRAVELYQRHAPDDERLATALTNLSLACRDLSRLDEAMAALTQAKELLERIAAPPARLFGVHRGMAAVAAAQGRLDLATELYGRALAIAEELAPGTPTLADLLQSVSAVDYARGALGEAEQKVRRALAILKDQAFDPSLARTLVMNLGAIADLRGQTDVAEGHYREALAFYEADSPNSVSHATALLNLARLVLRRGDTDLGEQMTRQALAGFEAVAPGSPETAAALTQLGSVALRLGDLDRAEELAERALAVHEALAPDSVRVAFGLEALGEIALRRGDLDRAEELINRSMAIRERDTPGSLDLSLSYFSQGKLAQQRGELETALDWLRRALVIRQRMAPDDVTTADVQQTVGEILLELGRADEAVEAFGAAVRIVETQRGHLAGAENRVLLTARHAGPYEGLVDAHLAAGDVPAAWETVERARARGLIDAIAERGLDFSADAPADLLDRESELHDRLAVAHRDLAACDPETEAARIGELTETLNGLRAEQRSLVAELRRTSPRLAALQYPEPLSAPEIQAALEPGSLLLAYDLGDDTSHVFAVTRESIAVADVPLTRDQVNDAVTGYRELATNRRADPSAAARELYQALIEPVAAAVDAAEQLLICPDGALHLLPFGALVSGGEAGPRYLIEALPVLTIPSATVYRQLRPDGGQRISNRLLAFADPALPEADNRLTDGLLPLHFARQEADQIAGLFGDQAQVLSGPDGTETSAKQARDLGVLHFACHAVYRPAYPLDSGLVLAADATEDGLLQVWEILQQVRLSADLVVLSACETGLGRIERFEGVTGLNRALLHAGARSVVVTLWRVADESTSELMTQFYAAWRDGAAKDEALRQAQLALIAEGRAGRRLGGQSTDHPSFWAPFVLVGDRH